MRLAILLSTVAVAACVATPAADTEPVAVPSPAAPAPDREPELLREIAGLRIQLLERSAQLLETDRRLGEATTEVVRAMARLRTLATRAEAASAIAEAEVTLQQLRGRAGQQAVEEARQAESALRAASAAFDAENYGGAVYLATQAKRAATVGRGRLAETDAAPAQSRERAFAVPVALTTVSRANLRAAPSVSGELVATVNAGAPLTAYAYTSDWIRVTMSDGRTAWVYHSLVRGVAPGAP